MEQESRFTLSSDYQVSGGTGGRRPGNRARNERNHGKAESSGGGSSFPEDGWSSRMVTSSGKLLPQVKSHPCASH